MRPAEKRKPTSAKVGSLEMSKSLAAIDTSENKGKPLSKQQRWRNRNPMAAWAHSATASAIRRGILVPPDRCEKCGNTGRIEAHHKSHYRNVLDVLFLCAPCHRRHHAALRKGGVEGAEPNG